MQCFILIGKKETQEDYLEKHISEEKIKSFNILRFEKKVKIVDVKQIIKSLSVKSSEKHKKLIILPSDITTDAQNALLKTLEELPVFVKVFILSDSKEKLLSTITSRCKVINLEQNFTSTALNVDSQELEDLLSSGSLGDKLSFASKAQELDDVIVALRGTLVKNILNNSVDNSALFPIYKFLENIDEYYPYLASNNLNLRFTLEHLLLKDYGNLVNS